MQNVKYERRGFIGIITIDRQSSLNALNAEVINELDQTLSKIPVDEVRCLILTGAGKKAFVAGADIGTMSAMSKSQATEWGKTGNNVFLKIENFPIPVIAAVNGYALGGGCELAMSCDLRVASENAVFGQPEVSLGIIAGFGGTQRLPRIVGAGRAKELLFTAARITADEAYRIGLVNKVCNSEQLMDECIRIAEKIAGNAPIAVRATKKAVNEGLQVDIGKAVLIESELFGSCFETLDQQNAMQAFMEKRKAEPFINK